jgi:ribonuclease D
MSESRYYADLCLVQLSVDDPDDPAGTRIEVLDPLNPDVDPALMAELLADPEIEIVMHAGRQDVAILRRVWQTDIRNVFDTQVAAGFVGAGAQPGYGHLLAAILGVQLDKSASFTRWDVRPLSREQVSYAREDVEHILQLSTELQNRLVDSGRLEWAREECRRLDDATDQRDPDTAYTRLPRSNQLKPRARAVARELAAWRERTAQRENKPVGSIVQDAPLVEIAKRQPADTNALEQIRGVHAGISRRRGQEILDAIARGAGAEPPPAEDREPLKATPEDQPVVSLAEAFVRARVMEAQLAYELVVTRSDMTVLVATVRRGAPEPALRILEGWRRELVGEEVLELLAGRRSLRVDQRGRLNVEETTAV